MPACSIRMEKAAAQQLMLPPSPEAADDGATTNDDDTTGNVFERSDQRLGQGCLHLDVLILKEKEEA